MLPEEEKEDLGSVKSQDNIPGKKRSNKLRSSDQAVLLPSKKDAVS